MLGCTIRQSYCWSQFQCGDMVWLRLLPLYFHLVNVVLPPDWLCLWLMLIVLLNSGAGSHSHVRMGPIFPFCVPHTALHHWATLSVVYILGTEFHQPFLCTDLRYYVIGIYPGWRDLSIISVLRALISLSVLVSCVGQLCPDWSLSSGHTVEQGPACRRFPTRL